LKGLNFEVFGLKMTLVRPNLGAGPKKARKSSVNSEQLPKKFVTMCPIMRPLNSECFSVLERRMGLKVLIGRNIFKVPDSQAGEQSPVPKESRVFSILIGSNVALYGWLFAEFSFKFAVSFTY